MIFLREDKQEYADATVLILHSMFKFPFFIVSYVESAVWTSSGFWSGVCWENFENQ